MHATAIDMFITRGSQYHMQLALPLTSLRTQYPNTRVLPSVRLLACYCTPTFLIPLVVGVLHVANDAIVRALASRRSDGSLIKPAIYCGSVAVSNRHLVRLK
jgi:hypothetical protein